MVAVEGTMPERARVDIHRRGRWTGWLAGIAKVSGPGPALKLDGECRCEMTRR